MFYSVLVVQSVLTFPQKATHQSHVAQRRVFPDAPRQNPAVDLAPMREETVPESNSPMVSDDTIALPPIESSPTESDSGPRTWTPTPGLAKPGVTEQKSIEPPAPGDIPETVDTFLLPEMASPPSKSDWSEIEN